MKYLTFIRHSESYRASPPPAALMEAMGKFVEKVAARTAPSSTPAACCRARTALRVRLANGKITVTDGPFTESKEVIGGWAILERETRRRRRSGSRPSSWSCTASTGPSFEGESEVRPMFDPGMGP